MKSCLTLFIILDCGPVDYNPPLKGQKFSQLLFLRLEMDLWDVCWSKCNCVGCGNGLSVLKEANKEKENTSKQKEHFLSEVAATTITRHTAHTPGTVTVNVITQYRTPTTVRETKIWNPNSSKEFPWGMEQAGQIFNRKAFHKNYVPDCFAGGLSFIQDRKNVFLIAYAGIS